MTIWQQRKELIRDRNFTLFLIHSFVTVAAGSMCYIVLTWHALSFHAYKPILATLLISFFFWLPSVVLSPLAGVIVDRYPRKRIIMISNFIRMLSFVVIGISLIYVDSLWLCCVLSLINGTVSASISPAVMAFVREIVPNEKLLAGNSTIDICIQLACILGMGFAGILIVSLSAIAALFVIASCIAIGIVILMFVQQNPGEQHHNLDITTPWQEFKDGLSYLIARPVLVSLYTLNTLLFIQSMIAPVLLAPYIKHVLHGTARDFSVVEVTLSIGMVVGGFLIPWIAEQYGRIRCLFGGITWLSLAFFLISINRSMTVLIVLYALIGISLPMWSVIVSYGQELTAKSMQGRMQATSNTMSSFALMLIYLILAVSNSQVTLAHCFWLSSFLGGLALIVLYHVYRKTQCVNVPASVLTD